MEQFLRFGKILPHPRGIRPSFFAPGQGIRQNKLPGWPGLARSKKFSPGFRGGCTQLEMTETLILTTCYSSIQSYFKIDLDLTMFTFYIENHEACGSKNCPKLDKNKSIVSRFSVFIDYKSADSTVQKSDYVGCCNFRQ